VGNSTRHQRNVKTKVRW